MPPASDQLSRVNEHSLPYRVLIEEIAKRRPDGIPADVGALLDTLDRERDEVRRCERWVDPNLTEHRRLLEKCAEVETPLKNILHAAKLSAICFSGGGIRSASFGLGVLTGLAELSVDGVSADKGVLKEIDYVSTVSGGGYLGSWFTGWIKRHPKGLDGVIEELSSPPATSTDPEPAPVRHLRDYTSDLARGDTWTRLSIMLRNLLLNWAILLPTFAAMLLLPVMDTYAFSGARANLDLKWLLAAAVMFGFIALGYVAFMLPGNFNVQPSKTNVGWVGVTLLLSAWNLAACFLKAHSQGVDFHRKFWLLWIIAGSAHSGLLGRFVVARGRERTPHLLRDLIGQIVASVASSALAAWILWLLALHVGPLLVRNGDVRLFTSLAVPLLSGVFLLSMFLLNGLSAQLEAEVDRQWWARFGAFALQGMVAWSVVHLLVLYSREITAFVSRGMFKGRLDIINIPVLTAFIGALASWAGFSPAAPSAQAKVDLDKVKRFGQFLVQSQTLVPVLAVLFYVLLPIVLAQASDALCRWIGGRAYPKSIPFSDIAIGFMCTLGLALVLNVYVNINTFSLQAIYRERLVRSYLGASNNMRRPNPFTNFDPGDNFPMKEAPADSSAPLHIVNIALNVVATKKLAWQQRKTESFTVSALHSGSFRVGYRPTKEYAGTNGISLGTAMSISGASEKSKPGYYSYPGLALVLTVFNARLGWWLPNPGPNGNHLWGRNGPVFSLFPLLNESLGRTTDENKWVYLSDGGHFENLGLYEMVLRRCKYIIVVDGSADPAFALESLGNAMRKIYIDLGVPIDFGQPVSFKPLPEKSERHWFIGRVRYSSVDGPGIMDGQLLYIKSSLTGDEPVGVTQYSKAHPEFPHESTANQFFNEAQFDSYVRLGSHIVKKIVGDRWPSPLRLEELFAAAADEP